jgi:hypothetical protein
MLTPGPTRNKKRRGNLLGSRVEETEETGSGLVLSRLSGCVPAIRLCFTERNEDIDEKDCGFKRVKLTTHAKEKALIKSF